MLQVRRVQRFASDPGMYYVWIKWEDEFAIRYPDGACPHDGNREGYLTRRGEIIAKIMQEDTSITKCQRRKRFEVKARDELEAFATVSRAIGQIVDIKV